MARPYFDWDNAKPQHGEWSRDSFAYKVWQFGRVALVIGFWSVVIWIVFNYAT